MAFGSLCPQPTGWPSSEILVAESWNCDSGLSWLGDLDTCRCEGVSSLSPRGFDVDMMWCEGGVSGSACLLLLLKSLKTTIHTRNGRKSDGWHFIKEKLKSGVPVVLRTIHMPCLKSGVPVVLNTICMPCLRASEQLSAGRVSLCALTGAQLVSEVKLLWSSVFGDVSLGISHLWRKRGSQSVNMTSYFSRASLSLFWVG